MEGNISLGDFIEQVKKELFEAHVKSTNRFLALQEVELEVQFELGIEGDVKGKLIVVEGQGKAGYPDPQSKTQIYTQVRNGWHTIHRFLRNKTGRADGTIRWAGGWADQQVEYCR